jgi:hypothetical protein
LYKLYQRPVGADELEVSENALKWPSDPCSLNLSLIPIFYKKGTSYGLNVSPTAWNISIPLLRNKKITVIVGPGTDSNNMN